MPNVIAASRPRWLTRSMRNVRHVSSRAPAEHDVEFPEQPMVLNEDGTRYLRKREYGHKPLPLSPLMDPILSAARFKYKQPKAVFKEERGENTEFRKELEKNVYARALATDIRVCDITATRLPKHFLIGIRTTIVVDEHDAHRRFKGTFTPDLPRDKRSGIYSPSRTYFHRDHDLLTHLQGSKKAQRKFVSERWENWVILQVRKQVDSKTHVKNAEFLIDPLFRDKVLSALQQEVVDKLTAIPLELYQPVELPYETAHGSTADSACILDMRTSVETNDRSAGRTDVIQGPDPPYRLPVLLSEAQLDTIRGYLGQDSAWVLSGEVETINARLALLKLASHATSAELSRQQRAQFHPLNGESE